MVSASKYRNGSSTKKWGKSCCSVTSITVRFCGCVFVYENNKTHAVIVGNSNYIVVQKKIYIYRRRGVTLNPSINSYCTVIRIQYSRFSAFIERRLDIRNQTSNCDLFWNANWFRICKVIQVYTHRFCVSPRNSILCDLLFTERQNEWACAVSVFVGVCFDEQIQLLKLLLINFTGFNSDNAMNSHFFFSKQVVSVGCKQINRLRI